MAQYSMIDQALADLTIVQKSNGYAEVHFNKSIEVTFNTYSQTTPIQWNIQSKRHIIPTKTGSLQNDSSTK